MRLEKRLLRLVYQHNSDFLYLVYKPHKKKIVKNIFVYLFKLFKYLFKSLLSIPGALSPYTRSKVLQNNSCRTNLVCLFIGDSLVFNVFCFSVVNVVYVLFHKCMKTIY